MLPLVNAGSYPGSQERNAWQLPGRVSLGPVARRNYRMAGSSMEVLKFETSVSEIADDK